MKPVQALLLPVALALVACRAPAAAMPTPLPASATATSAAPSPEPSATLPAAASPGDIVALYAAGPWDSPALYALAADGAASELGLQVTSNAAASPNGRWVAWPESAQDGGDMVVRSLDDGRTYIIARGQAGTDVITAPVFGGEAQLAYVEMGPVGSDGVPWAVVVVDLQDGEVRRFRTIRPWEDATLLPGTPLGWSDQGELVLDTFVPYSEGAFQGLWALTLPPSGSPDIDDLPRRKLLDGGSYMWPQLSPGGTHLLYLARDRSYTPAGYQTDFIDMAVNQLWTLEVATGQATLIEEETGGGALGTAGWSPDGEGIIFTQGHYSSGDRLGSLVLKAWDAEGGVREVGSLPLPAESYLWPLRWVRPELALALVSLPGGEMELYGLDLAGGGLTRLAEGPFIRLLGCVE